MPLPVSVTSTRTSFSDSWMVTVIAPFPSMASRAFFNRFSITQSNSGPEIGTISFSWPVGVSRLNCTFPAALLFQLRFAAYLSKPVGYQLQPVHIFLYFLHGPGIRIAFFQHFHPAFQGRYWGAQLVSRLFGHARPELVLRRLIADRNGIEG